MSGESVGSSGGASGAGGPSGASGASESKSTSASDRSDVSAAASKTSSAEVNAQAEAVTAGTTVDSFEKTDKPSVTVNGVAIGTPHATPSEGTIAERTRRENEKVEGLADKLAASSPTAKSLVDGFRAAGGHFEASKKGGFFRDGTSPSIHVPAGTDEQRMQTIAHELGHFDFRNNPAGAYVQPGNPPGISDRQIEHRRQRDYIVENTNRQLADEGHAALINNQIRNEYRAATGINLGVAGDSAARPMPIDPNLTIDQQRQTIGNFFGTHLSTSTTGENYRSYYGESYIDYYRDNFLPGR